MSDFDLDQVVEVVRREVELYRRLLRGQEEKIEWLLAQRHEEVERRAPQEQELIRAIKQTEVELKRRLQGKPLSVLIGELKHPHRTILQGLVEQFRRVLRELRYVNLRMERLLHTSLAFNQVLLQEIFPEQSGYDPGGRLSAGSASGKGVRW